MQRREFLVLAAASGTLVSIGIPSFALPVPDIRRSATAITQVFGDGVRLTGVAVEYERPVRNFDLSAAAFTVKDRTVTGIFTSTTADPSGRAETGRFVIISLSPEDTNAPLVAKQPSDGRKGPPAGGPGGPGKAGDIPAYDTSYRSAEAVVTQGVQIRDSDGGVIPALPQPFGTDRIENLVVDDFQQLEFRDPDTGGLLRYNLFVPKDYDAQKAYPLVLFMHDAGATSDATRTTLFQGLGAVCWASPGDQAARPCFVLAPQYAEIIADDDSKTSIMLDTTINLLKSLSAKYSIDSKRLYATGQSGGCMMAIAMNIKYPELFAASFLVAGQWDPALVKPLAKKKLWILVSEDDDKAWPGQNAITGVLEKEGAKVSRAIWDGTWDADQFNTAFAKIDAQGNPVNYVAFRTGTVIPAGESAAAASGHRNTWRIAYGIAPIREWIFRH